MIRAMIDDLLIERRAGWIQLTLNRPAKRNALNTALLGRLADALDAAAADPALRAAAILGADGHFAAGADLGEIADKTAAEAAVDPRKAHWARIHAFPKPLVAAVDGLCLGGGLELALAADLIVAGPTARFGLVETNLGFIPGAGGAHRLAALVGRARASRMVLLGEIIGAETALAWGLAAVSAQASAAAEAPDWADKLAARAPLALQAAKAALIDASEGAMRGGMAEARAAFERLMDTADKAEGVAALREKRPPRYRGA